MGAQTRTTSILLRNTPQSVHRSAYRQRGGLELASCWTITASATTNEPIVLYFFYSMHAKLFASSFHRTRMCHNNSFKSAISPQLCVYKIVRAWIGSRLICHSNRIKLLCDPLLDKVYNHSNSLGSKTLWREAARFQIGCTEINKGFENKKQTAKTLIDDDYFAFLMHRNQEAGRGWPRRRGLCHGTIGTMGDPVWYENPSGMIIHPAPPTFVARTECHITCLRLSGGKIIVYVEAGLMTIY